MATTMIAPVLLDNALNCNYQSCRRGSSIQTNSISPSDMSFLKKIRGLVSPNKKRTPSYRIDNTDYQYSDNPQPNGNSPFSDPVDAPPAYPGTPQPLTEKTPSATLGLPYRPKSLVGGGQSSFGGPQSSYGSFPGPQSPFKAPQPSNGVPYPTTSTSSALRAAAEDDPYHFLSSFDTIFIIDDSSSMTIRDGAAVTGGLGISRHRSRWEDTGAALEKITPICAAHDKDGIDIYFLNAKDERAYHNVKNNHTVREIFSGIYPSGGTLMGKKLHQIIVPYLNRYQAHPETTKPVNIICITDGQPSDDVESPLIKAAKKLDQLEAPAWQLGVQFFQVGSEQSARRHLESLDDELGEIAGTEIRDIVDTVPFTGAQGTTITGDAILKVVLGAVNRRLDRKKNKDLHH